MTFRMNAEWWIQARDCFRFERVGDNGGGDILEGVGRLFIKLSFRQATGYWPTIVNITCSTLPLGRYSLADISAGQRNALIEQLTNQ